MNGVSTLIFDLDGTLVDSSRGVVEAVNFALRQNGQPEKPPATICRYIGYPLQTMFADFTDVPYDRLLAKFRVRAVETVVSSAEPLDGVDETLTRLDQLGYRMGIATTKIKPQLDAIIDKLGWCGFFDATVGGDEVEKVKPAPDAFLLALKRLDADPVRSLAIGDTVNDVLSAKASGLAVVGIKSPFGDQQEMEAAGPDHMIETLAELPGLLDRLNGKNTAQ